VEYIVSLTLLVLIGIVVQPHFIATGGGSAKGEDSRRASAWSRGNFLKRLCTVGWALTALIALALLAGSPEIAADPDRVWGVAAREILGPLNLGLVGLMLACLLAAMMSSADTYMIVTSGLLTRNVYAAYLNPAADERACLRVARMTGLIIIVGADVVALTMADVFGQFKMAMEMPILFAAPFWIGMFWRRANRTAVWITIAFSVTVFFVLPYLLPAAFPGMRTDPGLTRPTDRVTTTMVRPATAADIARHDAWVAVAADAREKGNTALLGKLGPEPPVAALGEAITVSQVTGATSVFWQGGLRPAGEPVWEIVEEREDGDGRRVRVEHQTSASVGVGAFQPDFLLYHWLGFDLSTASKATIETLRLPTRLVLPFLVLIAVSYLTRRTPEPVLDRYYAKMRTEVDPDPATDRRKMEAAYADPKAWESQRLFPKTDWVFVRPSAKDITGFVVSVAVCFLIIGLLAWLAGIGSGEGAP
jgi:solute:Na+ symporter, SSS family